MFLSIGASVLAQTTGSPPTEALGSVWDFIIKGGPTMAVIILCSLVSLAIIVERFITLRRANVVPPDLLKNLQTWTADPARALDICRANQSPLANVLAAALRRLNDGPAARRQAAEEAGRREFIRLRRNMRLLSALPQVATMLGLLGTVFGMIRSFQAVAASAQSLGKTELLAKGIFEAWANTAAGLLVAIPVLIVYQVLMSRIDGLMADLDAAVTNFLDDIGVRTNTAPSAVTVPDTVAAPFKPAANSPELPPVSSAAMAPAAGQ